MKRILSFKYNLVLVCLAIFFVACSSNYNLVLDTFEKRDPIPESEKVYVVFATDIPVIPENSISIGTIKSNPEANCNIDSALEFLIRQARELGSNFLYIKGAHDELVARYHGFYTSFTRCSVIYADFLIVK